MSDVAPAVFSSDDVAAAVDAHGVSAAAVRESLAAVQAVAVDFPDLSVDDLVYEWRTRLHEDPLVAQTESAYFLDVRESVWADFADRGDVADVDAARTVHRARFARHLGGDAPDGAMVLARA